MVYSESLVDRVSFRAFIYGSNVKKFLLHEADMVRTIGGDVMLSAPAKLLP